MALLSRHCPRPEIKKDKVAFTNNSPMILMPEVKGKVYVIRRCETLHLFVPAGEPVSVKWTNVYIGGKKCYEKEY
jgi:hypothetical protein